MNTNSDHLSTRLRDSLAAHEQGPELSPELVTGASNRRAPQMVNRQRRGYVAGGATLAVAAVTVGALIVSAPTSAGPLFTASGTGNSNLGLSRAADSAATDLMVRDQINYQYEPGSGLSAAPGKGLAYQLKLAGSAELRAQELATALGVAGEPAQAGNVDPAYPTYTVGSADGTSESVIVTWSGTGSWWYSNPGEILPTSACEALPTPITPDARIAPEAGGCTPDPSQTPSSAPDEEKAQSLAQELFAATGFDVPTEDIRITVDPGQTLAEAYLTVGGIETALSWGISWSTTGEIVWAYGHSIEVVERGNFSTVSASDAVKRLADWRWFGAGGPEFASGVARLANDVVGNSTFGNSMSDPDATEQDTAEQEAAKKESELTQPTGSPNAYPTDTPLPEENISPAPAPEESETVVVTIDRAQETLLLMWDLEGNGWLVPGYAMQHPEGWWNTVASLEEGVIALPDPDELLKIKNTRVTPQD
ncbi:MAG: hypothetical protein ACRCSP_06125 [Rhodoglobus sp.]